MTQATRPEATPDEAADLLDTHWGLTGDVTVLPSERDQNFAVRTGDGAYVLRIANAAEDPAFVDAQHRMLSHLAAANASTPRIVPATDGRQSVEVPLNGAVHAAWLVTWIDGSPLADQPYRSTHLFRSLGEELGRMDAALSGFDHPAAHRDFHWDIAHGRREIEAAMAEGLLDPDAHRWSTRILDLYRRHAEGRLDELRRSVIHSDANPGNVVCGGGDDPFTHNQTVVGIIDFGDMVHSYTVANPAIAVAYAVLQTDDPLTVASALLGGYHAAHPLTEDEVATIWPMALLRTATSMAIAARQTAARPDDPYLAVSQEPIRTAMESLLQIPAGYATAVLRNACGYPPVASSPTVVAHLENLRDTMYPIMGEPLTSANAVAIDWSVASHLLDGDVRNNNEPRLSAQTAAIMSEVGARFGVGAYGQRRLVYTGDLFEVGPGPLGERRTIHLACDLFAPAGTPIHAPIGGSVFATCVNLQHEDYGHTIMLRHETEDGLPFWSLYGHLSAESVDHIEVGADVRAGDRIATLGRPDENGGWTPHVHVQLVTDMLDYETDFAGVGIASQATVWESLSPDPTAFCSVEPNLPDRNPPPVTETLSSRRASIGPSLGVGYRQPLRVVRGWMQYLWNDAGQKFLDAYNNVPHVGHAHPKVVEAARRQMGVLNTNTRYVHELLGRYAERLGATMPGGLDVCYFLNSASEANELALRLMRAATGNRDTIVLDAAYHGHTTGLIDISPYKHDGPGGEGPPDWVHTAPIADTYRGPWKATDPDAAARYAAAVGQVIDDVGHGRIAGFIAETCPSVGGQIIPPDGYLADVYRRVRTAGGVVVADEVQTGYGRLGTDVYGFQKAGVTPDIVVLGKPIGNGHPIGALVTTRAIADAFNTGMEFFSTFGGNTVSCAVGLAVLDVVETERLMEHAKVVGDHLLAGLGELADRHSIVGDVRGSGLFLGVELVRDHETLEPATAEASFVSNMLRERHILIGTDGPHHNVLKIRPPMPFTTADADALLTELDTILGWISL